MAEIRGQKKGKEARYTTEEGEIIVSVPMYYIVYDSSGTAGRHQILQTNGIPVLRSPVLVDDVPFLLTVKDKSAKQDTTNNKFWTVTVELDNRPESLGRNADENESIDPTQWIQLGRIEYEQHEEVADVTYAGTPIMNTARRPYSSPLMRQRLVPVIPFTQYEPLTRNLDDIMEWNETLNESTFLGKQKGMWMLTIQDCNIGIIRGTTCWKIEGKIRYKKRTLNTPSRFLYISDPVTNTLAAFTDTTIGGWQPLLAQWDYVDITGMPIVDEKGNQFRGKIDSNGLALSDQSEQPYHVYHETLSYLDFNAILRLTLTP
jgi:hypothetical protein